MTSPVTLGILMAYVVAKPLGIAPAGRGALPAGVGFTVALLIASAWPAE